MDDIFVQRWGKTNPENFREGIHFYTSLLQEKARHEEKVEKEEDDLCKFHRLLSEEKNYTRAIHLCRTIFQKTEREDVKRDCQAAVNLRYLTFLPLERCQEFSELLIKERKTQYQVLLEKAIRQAPWDKAGLTYAESALKIAEEEFLQIVLKENAK